jgi:aryl-alcohol dehydrogenase-like predicted oxidoreductase
VLPACRELGVGFVPFSPLGRAMLTGAITNADDITGERDMRGTMPRFQGENLEKNLKTVAAFGRLAEARGVTRGQLALAWLLAQGEYIAPIPGTKRVKYLEENAAAADITLSPGDLAQLDSLFAPGNIAGERYAAAGMRSLDRD